MRKFFEASNFKFFKNEIALCLTGIVLILIGGIFEKNQNGYDKVNNLIEEKIETSDKNVENLSYSEQYENQIEKILSQIDGIGNVTAAVYVKSDGNTFFAKNTTKDNSYIEEKNADSSSASEKKNVIEENIVILKDSQGNENAICIKKDAPEIDGIAVCISGKLNSVLEEKILRTLIALYNITPSNISIIN